MKIYILGAGYRLAEMALALSPKREDVLVLTSDEPTYRLCQERHLPVRSADLTRERLADLGIEFRIEDIAIISDYDEPRLGAILECLAAQRPQGQVLVFTPESVRALARRHPQFVFKSHRSVYRNELREMYRRVNTIQKVNALLRIVRERRRVLTVIWGNPDPDAIASARALQELLAGDVEEYRIAYTGQFTRQENLAMVHTLKVATAKWDPAMLASGPLLATVDAQPSFFQPPLPQPIDLVIDHHPLSELGPHRFSDVRTDYGSTSTILTEYFLDTGRRLPRSVATGLFYGLKVDTNNLTRNVSDADIDAFRALRMRTDENLLRTIEFSQMPLTMLDYFSIAISNKKVCRDVTFSYLGQVDNPDVGVYVADFFIKLSGISWVVVGVRTAEKLIVVFRTDGLRRHAGRIAESLFRDYGTAGGHRTMARAELQLDRVRAEVPEIADVAVERWLLSKLSLKLKALGSLR
ncbi:MAG: DHH family phosphoesterase [Planctomycetes bacterium]|nr:DHH family phosphoesterase [Planctomycetota bacterium]